MFCEQCGKKLEEGSVFCGGCGHKQGGAVVTMNQQGMSGSGNVPLYMPEGAGSVNASFANNTSYISSTGATGFVEASEVPLYSLANGVLNHLMTGRGINKDDAVITNKRLYYSHRAGIINKVNNEEIVNLKDITGTKIVNYRPIWLLLIAVFYTIAYLIFMFASHELWVIIPGLIVSAVIILIYNSMKDTVLSVEYAGGYIEFSMRAYGIDKVRFFQRCIYAAKEAQQEEEKGYVHKVSVLEMPEEKAEKEQD